MSSVDESNVSVEDSSSLDPLNNGQTEAVASTPTSLLNRKGLFGNSAAGLREPTPEKVAQQQELNEPSESLSDGINVKSNGDGDEIEKINDLDSVEQSANAENNIGEKSEKSTDQLLEDEGLDDKEANGVDSHESGENADDPNPTNSSDDDVEEPMDTDDVEEEVFTKKVISMDTSGDAVELETTNQVNNEEEEVEKTTDDALAEDDDGNEKPDDVQKEEGLDEPISSDLKINENEEANNDVETEEPAETPSKRTPRGRKSADHKMSTELEESENPVEVEGSRSTRSRRSATQKTVEQNTPTPRRGRTTGNNKTEAKEQELESVEKKTPQRRRGKKATLVEEDEAEKDESIVEEENNEEQIEEEKTPRQTRGRKSQPASEKKTTTSARGRRSKAAVVDVEEETENGQKKEEDNEQEKVVENESESSKSTGRRSTRTRNPVSTPKEVEKAVKTPQTGRGRRAAEKVVDEPKEEVEVEEIEETKTPRSRKSTGRQAKSTSTKTPSYKEKIEENEEYDPYDMDTEMEKHPEPLKNISMEVQNFGSVKYAMVGSSSKYEMTEKAAESRISNLSGVTPQRKERKSLAEMTPGKEKVKHTATGILTSAKRGKAKKNQEEDDEEMEVEEQVVHAPQKSVGRKRKSEIDSVPAVTPKKPAIELPNLSSEDQWKIDHPEDDNEPHAPGARIYALFDKVYYPAVIAAERDALHRFKVQFTADKIVKDVPDAGIIPLRAVVCGKACFLNDDVMNVLACPNAASADEWAKGFFELESLDEEGSPTGDSVRTEWSEIQLDMNDWRQYIKIKSSQATAIATDNITTPLEISRQRKPKVPTPAPKPVIPFEKKVKEPQVGDDTGTHLVMNGKAVGKNIFDGWLFCITTANRPSTRKVSVAYRKKNLQEFITANGGRVFESFHEVEDNDSNIVLISDTHNRTHKYLAALARGKPCIESRWLKSCADEGEVVDYEPFLLASGVSILYGDDRTCVACKNPGNIFSGHTFYVHSNHNTPEETQTGPGCVFIDIWKPIVKLLGGDVLEGEPSEISGKKFDVLVTDSTTLPEVTNAAEECGATAVTSEWIIQALINGEMPDFRAHPKFDPSYLKLSKEEKAALERKPN